eukprot:m.118745 g.118745  ORF g.118745 m.118745 type:complete len:717 (+) comp12900_c0_seq3:72-2222(+)
MQMGCISFCLLVCLMYVVSVTTSQNSTTCDPTPCVSVSTCSIVNGLATCSSCPSGYFGDGLVDGTGCRDINECKLSEEGALVPPVCDPNALCTNTIGSFSCGDCPPEYHGTGDTECIRVPSIDVVEDTVVINVDGKRDVHVSVGEVNHSLRQALSTIETTDQTVSTQQQVLADTSVFATSTRSTLKSFSTSIGSALSNSITSLSSSVNTVYSDVVDSTASLAADNSVELSRSHSALSSGVTQLDNQFGNLQSELFSALHQHNASHGEVTDSLYIAVGEVEEDVSLLSAETSSTQSTLLSLIAAQSSQNAVMLSTISSLTTQLSTFVECNSNGMLFSGESCVNSCIAVGDCDAMCSTDTAGTMRFRDDSIEYCDGKSFVAPSASTFGLLPLDPAESCKQLQDVEYGTGNYYIGEIGTSALHYCDMSTSPATDFGGDGTTAAHPASTCAVLATQFSLSATRAYFFKVDGSAVQLYCDVKTNAFIPSGVSSSVAAPSCKAIHATYPITGTAAKWVTGGGVAPFKVTCEGSKVVMTVKASDFSPTAAIFSYEPTNNWYKCRCANALSRIPQRTSTWYVGVVPSQLSTQTCEEFHEIEYTSASVVLSINQVNYLSTIANNLNFNVISTSCDDDSVSAPGGHWLGFESTLGSNDYTTIDCTSGEGGGGQTSPTAATANNAGCCDKVLGNQYATYPFPTRICGSINTGGGISLTFSTSTLKFD